MTLRILVLIAAFGLTGCCSFCEKHCDQCKQPVAPPPGYIPVGYAPAYQPVGACAPANPCAPYPGTTPVVARSAPAANCGCPQ
jgi:hypothetical protein